jgi:hypothetical protein
MEKNWLIRTKSNHILGPISKEKVLELYLNGSIHPDDEICSGNGYWFYIREKELVEKFLLGIELQGFNPLSEALQIPAVSNQTNPENRFEGTTLAYPSHESESREIREESPKEATQLSGVNKLPLKKEKKDYQGPRTLNIKKGDFKNQESSNQFQVKSENKQQWLKYLGVIGFILLFLLIYFRKTILYNFFKVDAVSSHFSIISSASADDKIKKKVSSVVTFNTTKFPFAHQLD